MIKMAAVSKYVQNLLISESGGQFQTWNVASGTKLMQRAYKS